MATIQIPYEFLVRWNHQTGVLQGAHAKFYEAITDANGVIIGGKEGDAMSVIVAGNAGFPLAEILSAIESGAIIAMEAANAALTAEKTAHAATQAAFDAYVKAHPAT